MKRLIPYRKWRTGGRKKLAKYVITEVRDKSISRREWSTNKIKTGFREMETIDDFDKGDFHSMIGVEAILEWDVE